MTEITEAVVAHNHPLLPAGQDMWVMQRISRGVEAPNRQGGIVPTIIIESHAIPFAARAALYRDGAHISTPSVPRVPPRFLSPRAKTHNYLNLIMGELEAHGEDPDSWAILAGRIRQPDRRTGQQRVPGEGRRGNDAEVAVRAGRGNRNQTLELAQGLGIPTMECDLTCTTRTLRTRRF